MGSMVTGVGLLFEEHRGDILASWKKVVEKELGVREPALGFAAAPLLRELTMALSAGADAQRSQEAWKRCAVLVRSTATGSQVVRELKALRRCAWDALRARGAPVSPAERQAADEWLDEALAEALDRLERVRQRSSAFEGRGAPVIVPALQRSPSPGQLRPPPLPPRPVGRRPEPARVVRAPREEILELDPIDGHA